VAAYFAVWTGFAAAALGADAGLHWLVDRWPWLAARPWLIGGSVLLLAGGFQFSPQKEQCLSECRSPPRFPAAPLPARPRRGLGPGRPARALLPRLLLGADAGDVRGRRREPGVDGRPDGGD